MKHFAVLVFFVVGYLSVYVQGQAQCPNAPATSEDRRKDKDSLTIATYNVEWLFLNGENCPGSGCPWTTYDNAVRHMNAVADEIAVINADILNLAEVQDCSVLTELNKLLDQRGMNYKPYLLTGTDTSTGQNMGLLTRIDPVVNLVRTSNRISYPIPGSKCTGTSGTSAVSKHYYTHFKVSGLPNPLAIFGMHFLAYPDDENRCVQREAQATVIAELMAAQAFASGFSVVTLGDLNDFDPTIRDAADSVPISQVLDILRDPLPNKAGDELINVASYVKTHTDIYSNWYDRQSDCNPDPDEFTLIDHVLISKDLTEYVDEGYMDHSYPALCRTIESDHWPVIVKFNLTLTSKKHSPDNEPATITTPTSKSSSLAHSIDSNMANVTIGLALLVTALIAVVLIISVKKAAVEKNNNNNKKQTVPLLEAQN